MSLITASFFSDALLADETVTGIVGDRITSTGLTYDEEDTWPVPYIIISYRGFVNDSETKDDAGESDNDRDTVEVLCVAPTCDELAVLVSAVRTAIRDAFRNGTVDTQSNGFEIQDYRITGSGASIDPDKPCQFMTLNYVCDVYNL